MKSEKKKTFEITQNQMQNQKTWTLKALGMLTIAISSIFVLFLCYSCVIILSILYVHVKSYANCYNVLKFIKLLARPHVV